MTPSCCANRTRDVPILVRRGGRTSLALCGWVTLAFAATLHISSGARRFVLMLLVMIPGAAIPFLATRGPLFAAIGAVAGIAGFGLLLRGLKRSAAFYRPRGFFGMTPGQPSAVR